MWTNLKLRRVKRITNFLFFIVKRNGGAFPLMRKGTNILLQQGVRGLVLKLRTLEVLVLQQIKTGYDGTWTS